MKKLIEKILWWLFGVRPKASPRDADADWGWKDKK